METTVESLNVETLTDEHCLEYLAKELTIHLPTESNWLVIIDMILVHKIFLWVVIFTVNNTVMVFDRFYLILIVCTSMLRSYTGQTILFLKSRLHQTNGMHKQLPVHHYARWNLKIFKLSYCSRSDIPTITSWNRSKVTATSPQSVNLLYRFQPPQWPARRPTTVTTARPESSLSCWHNIENNRLQIWWE